MIEANPELLMNNALRGHIVLQYVNPVSYTHLRAHET